MEEHVDEVVFSLMVRGRTGMLSHRSLTDPEKQIFHQLILFIVKNIWTVSTTRHNSN